MVGLASMMLLTGRIDMRPSSQRRAFAPERQAPALTRRCSSPRQLPRCRPKKRGRASDDLRLTSRDQGCTMQIQPYLTFKGDCEAAFTFYERCLGAQIGAIFRYAGTPMAD